MIHFPILSLLIWLPVLSAIIILIWPSAKSRVTAARAISVFVAVFSLALCIWIWFDFNTETAAMQYVEQMSWIPAYGMEYALGIDGISLTLMVLTCITTLLVVLTSWTMVHEKVSQYLATFLIMQGMIIGVFSATDALLFYFFWEAMLIPMYLSIGIWGGNSRSYAAIKFFIYTFLGSAILLIALLYLRLQSHSFAIVSFYSVPLTLSVQIVLFLAFLLAFGIKVPMWPVHTWLPDAHTEAPAGGSVILAALMLKMGPYGFLRFSLPIVPDACRSLDWLMIVLSLIAIVYVGWVALAQTDMKRLIAYSSVAHMGFVTLGFFMLYVIVAHTGSMADAFLGLEGGMMQMITHAFGSGAMFLAFGILYEQMHTREINEFGGIAKTMPIFAVCFMVYALSNAGLPGTSGFVGEFMVILSTFKASFWVTLLAASTLVIGAAYTLWMYKRVFFGEVRHSAVAHLKDIRGVNALVFVVLVFLVIWIGVYPQPILNVVHSSISQTMKLALNSKEPGAEATGRDA